MLMDKFLAVYNIWRINITYGNLMKVKEFYRFEKLELEAFLLQNESAIPEEIPEESEILPQANDTMDEELIDEPIDLELPPQDELLSNSTGGRRRLNHTEGHIEDELGNDALSEDFVEENRTISEDEIEEGAQTAADTVADTIGNITAGIINIGQSIGDIAKNITGVI